MGGKSHDEINAFTISCWPQLLAPNYCNVLFPAQQLWVFSYNAWRVWRTPDKRSETIFFIQNLSRSFRFTAPWRCCFSSVHLTHLLQGSGQRTETAIFNRGHGVLFLSLFVLNSSGGFAAKKLFFQFHLTIEASAIWSSSRVWQLNLLEFVFGWFCFFLKPSRTTCGDIGDVWFFFF